MTAGPSLNEQFAALLRRPSDQAALERLLAHDPEDLAVLLDRDLGHHLPHAPEQRWAVQVLDALTEHVEGASSVDPEHADDDPQLREARKVGEAFAHGLVPALPHAFEELLHRLEDLEPLGDVGTWGTMPDLVSVESGGDAARLIEPFGISPVTVAVAARGIARDLRRVAWLEERRIEVEPVVAWDAPTTRPHWTGEVMLVPVARLRSHVAFVAEIRREAGACLADWLLRVARIRLELFDGFAADTSRSDEQHLHFVPVERLRPLTERWSGA